MYAVRLDNGGYLTTRHELVDGGNTVLVIEHNLDVVKTADWVLDIGPEGGDGGGQLIAAGTPEDIAASKESWTGRFLAETFRRQDERRAARNKRAKPAAATKKTAGKATTKKSTSAKPVAKKTAAKKAPAKAPAKSRKAKAASSAK